MKKNILIVIIIVVVAIVAVGAAAVLMMGSPAKTTTQYATFQQNWLPDGSLLPFYVAEDRFWPQLGLDINIVRGSGSQDTANKVGSGVVEFGYADFLFGVTARTTGLLPIKAIGSVCVKDGNGFLWVKGRDAGRGVIDKNNLSTFQGKILGVPVLSSGALMAPIFAKANGLPADAIKVVNTDSGAVMPSLIRGDSDMGNPSIGQETVYLAAFSQAGLTADWIWLKDYGINLMGRTIWTNERVLHDNPDMVRKFILGIQEAFVWTIANEAEAAKIIGKYVPGLIGQDNVIITTFEGTRPLWDETYMSQHGAYYMPDNVIQSAVSTSYILGNIAAGFQLTNWADIYTNQFVDPTIKPTR